VLRAEQKAHLPHSHHVSPVASHHVTPQASPAKAQQKFTPRGIYSDKAEL
jgi:hypothetical protein